MMRVGINFHLPSAWYKKELKNNFRNLRPKMIDNPQGSLTITKVIISIIAGLVNGKPGREDESD